eukprot:m.217924 g.217924  ORF g.217924 m.217924 type:complete len:1179 (-) comp10155_c0_seq66:136-3672(-)
MRSMIASHRARPLGLAWLFCIAGAIHTANLCSTNVTSIFIRADTALSRIPLPTHSHASACGKLFPVCEEPRLPTSSFDVPFFGACVFSAVLQFVWSMCGAVKLNPRPGTHGHIEGRQRRAAKSPRFAAETTLERIVPYGQTWLIVIVCECTVELSCAPMARATMGHWIRGAAALSLLILLGASRPISCFVQAVSSHALAATSVVTISVLLALANAAYAAIMHKEKGSSHSRLRWVGDGCHVTEVGGALEHDCRPGVQRAAASVPCAMWQTPTRQLQLPWLLATVREAALVVHDLSLSHTVLACTLADLWSACIPSIARNPASMRTSLFPYLPHQTWRSASSLFADSLVHLVGRASCQHRDSKLLTTGASDRRASLHLRGGGDMTRDELVAFIRQQAARMGKADPNPEAIKVLLNVAEDPDVTTPSHPYSSQKLDTVTDVLKYMPGQATTPAAARVSLEMAEMQLQNEWDEARRAGIVAAFSQPYKDPHALVDRLIARVRGDWATFRATPYEYLAAYIIILQSSLYGKSRLLRELGLKEFTVFLCVREDGPPDQFAYPPPDASTRELLLNGKPEAAALYLLVAWLLACVEWRELHPEAGPAEWREEQSRPERKNRVVDQAYHWITRHPGYDKPGAADMSEWKLSPVEAALGRIRSFARAHPDFLFVMALDEVHTLNMKRSGNTLFEHLCRALSILQHHRRQSLPLFVLVSDTQWPQESQDHTEPSRMLLSSARGIGRKKLCVFPPFVHITTADVLALSAELSTWTVDPTTGRPRFDIGQLCRLGRAGIGSYLNAGYPWAGSAVEPGLMEILEAKLFLHKSPIQVLDGPFSLDRMASSMAVLGSLVAMDFNPAAQVSSLLVASRMATCVGVSEDRRALFCAYVSEPALSLAARRLFSCRHDVILSDLIYIISNGLTDAGKAGEVVCQLVLQHAIIAAIRKNGLRIETTITLPLLDILRELLTADVLDAVSARIASLTSFTPYAAVTHFIPVHYDAEALTLAQCWRRSAAIHCKSCKRGMDWVIPVLWVPPPSAPAREGKLSPAVIQVKNRKDVMSDEAVVQGLSLENCFAAPEQFDRTLPYLSIHMSVHPTPTATQRCLITAAAANQVAVRINGLDTIPCLSQETLGLLLTAAESLPDIRSLVSEQEQAIAAKMMPECYRPEQLSGSSSVALTKTKMGAV